VLFQHGVPANVMVSLLRYTLSVNEEHGWPSIAVGFHVPEVDYHDFHAISFRLRLYYTKFSPLVKFSPKIVRVFFAIFLYNIEQEKRHMKKILIALLFAAALCTPVFGHHHYHGGFGRPAPIHHHHPHFYHHHGYVAPLAFGAGLLLGSVVNPPAPVVVPNRVWIPGYYVTNYDAYGRPFQTYVPGHWEYR
jgi:hypothetical protein